MSVSDDPTQPIGVDSSDPTLPARGGRASGRTGAFQPPEGTNPGPIPPRSAIGTQGQAAYYGAYPGPMAPSTSYWAIASLMVGILSYLGFFVVGGLLAIVFGHIALSEINRSNGQIEGRGLAIAGLVLGYAHFLLVVCIAATVVLAVYVFGLTFFGLSR